MAEENENPAQKPPEAEAPKPAEPKAAAPKPPPPPPKPPGAPAAGGHPAPPKPKGPAPEPWSHPLVDALKERFGAEILKAYTFLGQRQIDVKPARIVEISTFLRDNPQTSFDLLNDETAIHWPKEEEFEVVYNLYSMTTRESLRIKARVKEWEEIESVVAVWETANWLEREIYDMFGLRFANHPNLKRILLPEDWVGFPLRKDYNIRLQDVEWVRKHLGIESGQKYYVDAASAERGSYVTPTD